MAGLIKIEKVGFLEKTLLTHEVPGIELRYAIVREGSEYVLVPEDKYVCVLFFTKGLGSIKGGGQTFLIEEMAVFLPHMNTEYSIAAAGSNVEYLEVLYEMTAADNEEMLKTLDSKPYFSAYSKCSTYRESIKSEKTVNRTIVPENTVPRFCMGSVETTGKDEIGRHAHPMLEQFFFGLSGNSCVVGADEKETPFTEDTLLHIPLGSMHGVKVEEGHKVHYIWMDFFKNNDLSYITETHKTE